MESKIIVDKRSSGHEPVTEAKKARFCRLCEKAMLERRAEGDAGIGTLAEKRMHAIIKKYLCEDEDCHEVGVAGSRYVSDVRIGNDIYEVQTGAFAPMKKKIGYYLANTPCTVTVVHPVVVNRWVSWIDPVTRDITERNKAPRKGGEKELLHELYCLTEYLGNERLKFRLMMIDAEDFRMLAPAGRKNRKKGTERYERIPTELREEIDFEKAEDYKRFLPEELPTPFTVKDYTKATGIRGIKAYSAVRVLAALELIRPAEPVGRAMAFEKA